MILLRFTIKTVVSGRCDDARMMREVSEILRKGQEQGISMLDSVEVMPATPENVERLWKERKE